MKKFGLQFIRGGQISLYTARMMAQVTHRILMWAICGYILVVALLVAYTSQNEIRVLGLEYYSEALSALNHGDSIVWQEPGVGRITAEQYLNLMKKSVVLSQARAIQHLIRALIYGGVGYFLFILLIAGFFVRKGEKYSNDKYVSGTRLALNLKETIRSVQNAPRGQSDIRLLGKLPMPRHSETQGIFFHGTTGAGKTQAIMQLLDEIRRLGEPAIIYDKECTIKPYFFDESKDVELNPISKQCANWDMWQECLNPMEIGNLAAYLIPKSLQGGDPFWVDSARTILTSMAWKIRERDDKSAILLLQLLLTTTLDEMRVILKGTESENLVSKEIEKTAISIKSVLATYTKALRFLDGLDATGRSKFSIRQWVEQAMMPKSGGNGWLFITSRSKYHKEIKPLISLWLGLAMQAIQSLPANTGKRIWLVMDELASLQRLEMLSDTVADIRKFGGCVAIGVQSISQLEFLYGNYEGHAIADLLNTSLYFRSPKSRVAKWVAQDLGEQIIEEVRESQSYGPSSMRDGNTIGTQRATRVTVDAGSIMTLEDLTCYVRMVGDHPIAKVQNEYIKRTQRVIPLVERSIDFDALEKINRFAVAAQSHHDINDEVKKIHQFEDIASLVAQKKEVEMAIASINSNQVIGEMG